MIRRAISPHLPSDPPIPNSIAKKKPVLKRKPKPGSLRYRRTDEELTEDLQKRIDALKQRKEAKKLKANPATRQAQTAYRALTKGIELAEGAENAELKRLLSEAQRMLAEFFESQGVKLPKARKPRARKKN